jgi:hypothetical protein
MSGGKAVRHKVLTTENSSWNLTKRKTMSDKISDKDIETAYTFWVEPQTSRPTGNKSDVKRVRLGPKLY